ncbi:Wsc3p SKDI_15G0530 [Saccharomyces kudriavzevii IFO 1802]|uniref:WSC domain-containing protein n=1 Tax=Saccharomyces kudriavzevii (strain ATCC MYA-4449 / AS 2.2408 / CBS 8840 / NBRC 1802 / NCYC 2889) TaxID=226230 RepID=A0AA35J979_SACK1|nr:uncharacterized protein SKDI_15G0530 [Saccharomyces kudriavzevii IFO 1802]CAI4050809.1 hypothetical protein SKDI_15G0530 [Saccharomyces kudriavzevii IFO 1802]
MRRVWLTKSFMLLSLFFQYLIGLVSAEFNYEGCYNAEDVQSGGLSLKNSYLYQSVSYCQNECPGSAVVALFNGSDCYCGNSVTFLNSLTKSTDSNCNSKCSGWPYQMCGGSSYVNVYINAEISVSSIESSSSIKTFDPSSTHSSTLEQISSNLKRTSSSTKSSTTSSVSTATTSTTISSSFSTATSSASTTTSSTTSYTFTSSSSTTSTFSFSTTSSTFSAVSASSPTMESSSSKSTTLISRISSSSSALMSSSSSSSALPTSTMASTISSTSSKISIVTSVELITSMVTKAVVSTSDQHQETIFITTTSVVERTSAVATADSLSNKSNSNHKKSLSGGAIAGIVIGVVIGVISIILILLFLLWRRRKSEDPLDLEETKHYQPYSFGDADANPVRPPPPSGAANWMRHSRGNTAGSIGTSNVYGLSLSNGANYSSPSSNTSGSVVNNLSGLQDATVQTQNLPSTVFEEADTLNSASERFSANSLPDMMMSRPLQVVNPDDPELSSTASHHRA